MKRKLQVFSADVELVSIHLSSRANRLGVVRAACRELKRLPMATHALLRDKKGRVVTLKEGMNLLSQFYTAFRIS
ncbi:hypothetical protein PVT67_06040 [Gallaecimonas kandeliae]|uniref:hypothetical protein n=1 Tax=Gallaecimonas kandeliae TaxID=3029055 RepID=UPI002647BADA|nr:hypothetical protein [Gallaecimonas kandeliae]WKE66796.1 hypothetical protein PVT67_06040 [Gallaecimonas kandeliae]